TTPAPRPTLTTGRPAAPGAEPMTRLELLERVEALWAACGRAGDRGADVLLRLAARHLRGEAGLVPLAELPWLAAAVGSTGERGRPHDEPLRALLAEVVTHLQGEGTAGATEPAAACPHCGDNPAVRCWWCQPD